MSDMVERLNAALKGRYAIERELGEGGMATVYLADDLKHERKVALKVLKPELAAVVGAERFLAEIKTTANLQHPHILPLFDSGEADSFLYYVMPFVEGETLRDRLDRETQLPVDDVVRIGTAVANALDYAHRNKVVHRDIKPANILLHDGEPVVADFGIGLALGAAGGDRLTETGLSMGTPQYMSPEQAAGDRGVGPPTDVYALGCVLYEMLVGEPPYTGTTAQAILAKILMGAAKSVVLHRPSVPPNVDAAIGKALEKLPADRFSAAEVFARALADTEFRHGGGLRPAATTGPWNALSLGLAATTAVLILVAGWALTKPGPTALVDRYPSPFTLGQEPSGSHSFDHAPDGSFFVYRIGNQLWLRRWTELESTPIRGTEGGEHPTVSPDGSEFAFDVGDEIKVLSFASGGVRSLMPGEWPRWGNDGYIYSSVQDGTLRTLATEGVPQALTSLADGESSHLILDILPGGEGALVVVQFASRQSEIRALSFDTGEMEFVTLGHFPRYANSGHLLFRDPDGSLAAARFDPNALELSGRAVPLVEDIFSFRLSDTGTLIYRKSPQRAAYEFVWVTREGMPTLVERGGTHEPPWELAAWSLSPDGGRVALAREDEIWIKQVPEGPVERLTFSDESVFNPRWTADGLAVTYVSQGGNGSVWSVLADRTGEPTLMYGHSTSGRPRAGNEVGVRSAFMSPDGWLIIAAGGGDLVTADILAMRPAVDTVPQALLSGDYDEVAPALSPNGQWLAYSSNENGRFEVYIRPFPHVDGAGVRVSLEGGGPPHWSRSGSELFFRDANRVLVAAQLEIGSNVGVTNRERLFTVPSDFVIGSHHSYLDVPPGDQQFLMARAVEDGATRRFILVRSYLEELKTRVPN